MVHELDLLELAAAWRSNVKRRLALLYPGRHDLNIREGNGEFHVTLTLAVDENKNELPDR